MVDRQTRDELNALSKEVFGASSRWQKLIDKGYAEVLTEEVTEYVPAEVEGQEGTERKVNVPIKRQDGAVLSTTKHHTVDSVRTYMLDLKKKQEEFQAMLAKLQADQNKKQEQEALAKSLHADNAGSAV